MDRSTKATLITYNTRICLDGLSRISNTVALLLPIGQSFPVYTKVLPITRSNPEGFEHLRMGRGTRTAFSTDSDLEAFSRNPADGSLAALAVPLTALTKCLNERFLSY